MSGFGRIHQLPPHCRRGRRIVSSRSAQPVNDRGPTPISTNPCRSISARCSRLTGLGGTQISFARLGQRPTIMSNWTAVMLIQTGSNRPLSVPLHALQSDGCAPNFLPDGPSAHHASGALAGDSRSMISRSGPADECGSATFMRLVPPLSKSVALGVEQGEVFDVRLTRMPGRQGSRFISTFQCWYVMPASFKILLGDIRIAVFYAEPAYSPPNLTIQFPAVFLLRDKASDWAGIPGFARKPIGKQCLSTLSAAPTIADGRGACRARPPDRMRIYAHHLTPDAGESLARPGALSWAVFPAGRCS